MIFDSLSMFSDKQTVAVTAGGATNSGALDLRLNGEQVREHLKIYAQIVGTKNTAGAITTKVQTSANGSNWSDLGSGVVQDGNVLFAGEIPVGAKRYIRLVYTVGSTALNSAMKVTAGLVDAIPSKAGATPTVQAFPPLEDNAAKADAVRTSAKLV